MKKILSVFFLLDFVFCDQNSIRESILEWYKSASVQKPLKCEIKKEFLLPYSKEIEEKFMHESMRDKLIEFRECDPRDQFVYTFKGEIKNGHFEVS